jgi:hypothetical protein
MSLAAILAALGIGGETATEAAGAAAAAEAASAASATGIGAGVGTIGSGVGTLGAGLGIEGGALAPIGGTFGGLGVGGTGAGLTGVGAGLPSLLGGTAPAYGAGTLGGALAGTAPSLLYGTGGLLGPTTGFFQSTPGIQPGQGPASYTAQNVFNPQPGMAQHAVNAMLKPTGNDLLDNLLVGLTLSGAPEQMAGQGGERGIQPAQLPNQIAALPPTQNRGRMGFNANGILSWLPQTPQVPQAPGIPGALPPTGMYRG